MLTPTDAQYLVGLLLLVSTDSAVDVVLGERVYDKAARSRRDVDVVTYRGVDGRRRAVAGVEVKKRSRRPLDDTHVEQLALKLKDMPDLAERGIVSATGFTRPAVSKALHHGIGLYHLREWKLDEHRFRSFAFPPEFRLGIRATGWKGTPNVRIEFSPDAKVDEGHDIDQELPVLDAGGNPHPSYSNARALCQAAMSAALDIVFAPDQRPPEPTEPFAVEVILPVAPESGLYFAAEGALQAIASIRVRGMVAVEEYPRRNQFMVLVAEGSDAPTAGCAVTLDDDGRLWGLTVSDTTRTLSLVTVSPTDRKRGRAFRQQLARAPVEPLRMHANSVRIVR